MHPSINNTNNKTNIKGEKNPQTQNFEDLDFLENQKKIDQMELDLKNSKRKKVALKKEKVFAPPILDEVLDFFKQENFPEKEGRKFFYHFESNGWKVGGKTPMKNWNAAAHNWMLNTSKFGNDLISNVSELNKTKDYGEPL